MPKLETFASFRKKWLTRAYLNCSVPQRTSYTSAKQGTTPRFSKKPLLYVPPLFTFRLPILYQPVAGIKQETKFLLDKLKVPERPKKPLTAYFRFLLEYRGKVLKENPGIKITEVTKTASEAWRELDEAKKADYEQQHRDELDRYTKQYLDYEAKLTDEQRAVLQAAKEEKLQERKKRKLNKVTSNTSSYWV